MEETDKTWREEHNSFNITGCGSTVGCFVKGEYTYYFRDDECSKICISSPDPKAMPDEEGAFTEYKKFVKRIQENKPDSVTYRIKDRYAIVCGDKVTIFDLRDYKLFPGKRILFEGRYLN